MRIDDQFRVDVPVERAWDVLLDVERIAPCLPGAELQEVEGDEYRGVVKVKVGPITAQYKGSAKLDTVDEANRTIVIRAVGRDTRGQGNATATITARIRGDGDATEIAIETDLAITGKVAQFGRGVLADVSTKLLGQFVENLERDVLAGDDGTTATPVDAAPAAPSGNGAGPRRVEAAPAEPVDLLEAAGGPVARRFLPLGVALAGLLVTWWLLRRRRRHSGRRQPQIHRQGGGAP